MAKDIAYVYDIYIGAPVAKVWKGSLPPNCRPLGS
jgi:hypothetical protein